MTLIPLCRVKDLAKNKILKFEFLDIVVAQTDKGIISLPVACPHAGFDLSYAKVQDSHVVCPYHNRCFVGSTNNIKVIKGIVFYENEEESKFGQDKLLEILDHPRLSSSWHKFEIACYYKHLLSNLVDAEHFSALHGQSGGLGLSNVSIETLLSNSIKCTWQSSWNRSQSSLVTINDYSVVSTVPYQSSFLHALNLVVPKSKTSCTLLVNSFFEHDVSNCILDISKNIIVYILAYQDKWVLERLATNQKPNLHQETNPLVHKVWEDT